MINERPVYSAVTLLVAAVHMGLVSESENRATTASQKLPFWLEESFSRMCFLKDGHICSVLQVTLRILSNCYAFACFSIDQWRRSVPDCPSKMHPLVQAIEKAKAAVLSGDQDTARRICQQGIPGGERQLDDIKRLEVCWLSAMPEVSLLDVTFGDKIADFAQSFLVPIENLIEVLKSLRHRGKSSEESEILLFLFMFFSDARIALPLSPSADPSLPVPEQKQHAAIRTFPLGWVGLSKRLSVQASLSPA
jgi:hypothetical protein